MMAHDHMITSHDVLSLAGSSKYVNKCTFENDYVFNMQD